MGRGDNQVTRMGWGEMWKWLHRIKGIVATVKGALQGEQRTVATNVVAMIERMRPRLAVNTDGSTTPTATRPLSPSGRTTSRGSG